MRTTRRGLGRSRALLLFGGLAAIVGLVVAGVEVPTPATAASTPRSVRASTILDPAAPTSTPPKFHAASETGSSQVSLPVGRKSEAIVAAAAGGDYSISGHVDLGTAGNSAPVGSVTVTAYAEIDLTHAIDSVVVDKSGNFLTDGLNADDQLASSAGFVALRFTYKGTGDYHSTWFGQGPLITTGIGGVETGPGTASIGDEVLTEGYGSITGKVTLGSAGGAASSGEVSVTASGFTGNWTTDVTSPVLTDASGNYTIPQLVPGTYILHFTYLGTGTYQSDYYTQYGPAPYSPSATQLTVTGGEVDPLNMDLLDDATLAVHIYLGTTAQSAGSGDVSVKLIWDNSASGDGDSQDYLTVPGSIETDSNGDITVGGLLSNVDYYATLSYTGSGDFALTSATSFRAGYSGLTDTIPVGYSISGHVYIGDASHAAQSGQVEVTLNSEDPGGLPAQTTVTDANGMYSFGALAGGFYSITLHYLDAGDYPDVVLTSAPPCFSEECWFLLNGSDITNADGTIIPGDGLAGTVTNDSGKALADVSVTVSDVDPSTFEVISSRTLKTSASGLWAVQGLPDGAYEIDFDAGAAYAPQSYENESNYYEPDLVTLQDGDHETGINARMHLIASVHGTATLTHGVYSDVSEGNVSVEVMVFDGPSQRWVETGDYYGVTGTTGHYSYSIPKLAPGDYRLLTVYNGAEAFGVSESATFDVAAGRATVENVSVIVATNAPFIGSLVRSTHSSSPTIYLVDGEDGLIPIPALDYASSMGVSTKVTEIDPVLIASATIESPLNAIVSCSGSDYVAGSGALWPIASGLVGSLAVSVLDPLTCESIPTTTDPITTALLITTASSSVWSGTSTRLASGSR